MPRKPAATVTVAVPPDIASALAADPAAAAAFEALAPSCRREHLAYITEAKKPETRLRRIEKTLRTLRGEGAA